MSLQDIFGCFVRLSLFTVARFVRALRRDDDEISDVDESTSIEREDLKNLIGRFTPLLRFSSPFGFCRISPYVILEFRNVPGLFGRRRRDRFPVRVDRFLSLTERLEFGHAQVADARFAFPGDHADLAA